MTFGISNVEFKRFQIGTPYEKCWWNEIFHLDLIGEGLRFVKHYFDISYKFAKPPEYESNEYFCYQNRAGCT